MSNTTRIYVAVTKGTVTSTSFTRCHALAWVDCMLENPFLLLSGMQADCCINFMLCLG